MRQQRNPALPDNEIALQRRMAPHVQDQAVSANNMGNALRDQGKFGEAVAFYQQALALVPNYAIAHCNLGSAYEAQGNLDQAADCYQKALALRPDISEAHFNLAGIFSAQGRLDEAIACCQRAITIKPDFTEAYNNLGILLTHQDRSSEAIDCYQKALALDPNYAHAYVNLGISFRAQGKLDEAVACYRKALTLKPDFPEAYANLGNALNEKGDLDEAVVCFQRGLAFNPNDAATQLNLGNTLRGLHKLNEAVSCYLNAIALKPDFAEAFNNLGLAFDEQGNPDAALECYQTALALKPDFAAAYNNLGIELKERGQLDEAMACYQKALALNPDYVEAHSNLGIIFHVQGMPDKAIACHQRALEIQPDYVHAHNSLLLAAQYSASVSPEDMFAAHLRFGEQFETPLKPYWQPHTNARDARKRLKIGYVSADFCKHPVSYFMEPVLACHDRSQVEVFCYYNRNHVDPVTRRLWTLADHWIPCMYLSDEQLAQQIRADGIDILVDLSGHTGHNRLLTFARKPAPVQVTYLGYPATTGLTAINYRLTDIHAEPPGMTEQFNVEQLWRLPEMFCVYRAHEDSPAVIDHPPAKDNGYITFGCFNNFIKVSDPVIALWAQLLTKVPSARLMLEIQGVDDFTRRSEIEQRLARLGIPVQRLILVPRKPENQYSLYNRIDIALDPFPCNGGTTSLDALWMGVPFVTLAGRHFSSRLGVTVLTNAGLPELIANNEQEYLEIAAALALDWQHLKRVRNGLRERVQVSPLMNVQRFTTHLEQAYRGMWKKWCGGDAVDG